MISEEYGNWEDARRRIDLLALDKQRRLVVIERSADCPRDAGPVCHDGGLLGAAWRRCQDGRWHGLRGGCLLLVMVLDHPRLSTPRPTASAAAAASGGTGAVALPVSECPVTWPTLPATDTATQRGHEPCCYPGSRPPPIGQGDEQGQLAYRDEHIMLEGPHGCPEPGNP